MRVRINDGRLDVDLMSKREQVTNVIALALAAGLTDFRSYRSEHDTLGVLISAPNGAWAKDGFTSLLLVTAALNGVQTDQLIEQFHSKCPDFAAAAQPFAPAAQAS